MYDQSGGRDGFASFECTPDLADDADGTIAQATELWRRLGVPNVMIKVPGTAAGLAAIQELTRLGINVNVTLLFSVERYEQVIDAYLRGLSERAKDSQPLDCVSSVASFFLSRIDTLVDRQLPPTATKSPAYSDVRYAMELAGPDVINKMPWQTLRAFADHGAIKRVLGDEDRQAERMLIGAREAGIDLRAVTDVLQRDGLRSFCDSYVQLLGLIEQKVDPATAASPSRRPVGPAAPPGHEPRSARNGDG